jgi:hypothetical protein
MRRAAAAVALVVAAALVVLGQVAGLDPNDSSSTGTVALFVLPMYACLAVGLVVGGDHLARFGR